ncbi:bifunctional [glutamine synthetase] adenylyltransferase/[glutamine synthetase]-adenylyl-L-tyrosine phosphorylase [Trueperella bernardiae]|uniref:bifunctional [glutamine synthetase] adenylyltransferase/[glutamine synthetase]-adenylyl-L-tyrosine phosphorylase n=1 Tax=Trueperella bernardiae TaxID=59561 RepID=UPI0029497550|nr:bifunctional [glutamine synthetase] adenylyltransferase/[glutamine synthetase]-adenylyl-L-tyrosine phosphorylase [Trueperella bernardiae]MDV6238555.1 bifunctional [glutamine synthetase] adenylyltransferase/[glutamine synthetase]-adenylyl-L-tyrosine phosphorylase [Trueperella bernardiae]
MWEAAKLRRAGFSPPDRAARLLESPALAGTDADWLLAHAAGTADPNQALLGYLRLTEAAQEAGPEARRALTDACQAAPARLFAILGMSTTLTEHLISHPTNVHILSDAKIAEAGLDTTLEGERASALAAVRSFSPGPGEPPRADLAELGEAGAIEALRLHYWYRLTQIAALDLTAGLAPDHVEAVARALSDVVGGALEAALAVGRAVYGPEADDVALAIIAMGKTGGREVNYISDVDVIYVAGSRSGDDEADLPAATKLAEYISHAVAAPGRTPAILQIDTALRPEGKAGPLVRTLDSHVAYYEKWAENWEFQALLKARPVAGDRELGERYVAALTPLVWNAAGRDGFVEETRAMRRRVESLVPAKDAERQIKLGRGGLRDIEFTVQLLQLVHGRTDPSVRQRSTLEALAALRDAGYIGRTAAATMDADYRLLRALEHRVQLHRIRRSHVLPTADADLRRIARSLRVPGLDTAEELGEMWARVRKEVRALHLEIYYRPMLPATAKLSADNAALEPEAAQARLAAIGYGDPRSAYANALALTSGFNRTAAIARHIMPVMLEWFAQGPEPDRGLAAFRDVSEKLGSTPWYMRLLRDSKVVGERLARLLSTSRYVANELPSQAEAIAWLEADELAPLGPAELTAQLDSVLNRRTDPREIAIAGRALRRRELLRTAMADTLRLGTDSRQAITDAGQVAVEASLRGARIAASAPDSLQFAVIAMGRFGGGELGYISDADLLFVFDHGPELAEQEASAAANEVARHLIALLSTPAPEPGFPADADLRPEGKNGPLARSLDSYRAYYDQWVQTWERQALLRARFVAGDGVGARFISLINPLRYPSSGLADAEVRDIRRMKARVESERIPRGVDKTRHLKLGPGGLANVEWAAQILQLRHAGRIPALRTTGTLSALDAASESGLISADGAGKLIEAWSFASALRDANVLASGRTRGAKLDLLPHGARELALTAALLGREGELHAIEEDYLRAARRARAVVERIVYEE